MGDFRLWMKLVLKYPIYILCEELTYYRRHGNNLSEPTMEKNIQTANEWFWLFYETLDAMPPSVFFRTFYERLPYVWDGSEEALWAAKFILLAGVDHICAEQATMTFFFKHCDNVKFLAQLEERYLYKAQDFYGFTCYGGLQYSLANLCQPALPTKNIKRNFSAGEILIRHMQPENAGEVLKLFRYSALYSLFEITGQNQGSNLFLRIKSMIETVRRQVREQADPGAGKVLVLIAEDSEWDVVNGIEEMQREYPSAEFLAAFVSSRKNMFSLSYAGLENPHSLGENVRELCLYDREEHCLRFPQEKGESVDVIWYVDCLGADYECEKMALGYPLMTEQNVILKKSVCDKLEAEDTKSLYLLEKIKVYG